MLNDSRPMIAFDATPLEVPERAGVSRYAAQLLEALVEAETGTHPRYRYALLASRPLRGPVPAPTMGHVGPRLPNRWLWMQLLLPGALARLRPDLCHFTNSIAPLRSPSPYVLTLHDMALFLYPRTQPRKSRLLVRTLIPAVARRAAAVVAPSHSARRDIVAVLGLAAERVHVVYEAAAPAFRPIDCARELGRVRRRYALEAPFLLTVGTVEPRKNLDRLLAAFARIHRTRPACQFVLAGQLGWRYRGLLAEIDRLGLRSAVRVLGYVPDGDLPALYNLAVASAFPSLYEGFGLPVLESMACGTPVLTSNRAAMAEVANGAALLVDPTDVGALADALASLLSDRPLRERLAAAGRERAAGFTWQRVAQETTAIYRHVLERVAPAVAQGFSPAPSVAQGLATELPSVPHVARPFRAVGAPERGPEGPRHTRRTSVTHVSSGMSPARGDPPPEPQQPAAASWSASRPGTEP